MTIQTTLQQIIIERRSKQKNKHWIYVIYVKIICCCVILKKKLLYYLLLFGLIFVPNLFYCYATTTLLIAIRNREINLCAFFGVSISIRWHKSLLNHSIVSLLWLSSSSLWTWKIELKANEWLVNESHLKRSQFEHIPQIY